MNSNLKVIGTDVSLDVCKAEGYTMIEFIDGEKFDRTKEYRIFDFYPEYCEGIAGEEKTNTFYSFDSLVELYIEDKEGMDSFAETNKFVDFNNPDYYDFLNLASDLIAYKGL